MDKERIRAKVKHGLPLTSHEKAVYLLFLSTKEEMQEYLDLEKIKACKTEQDGVYTLTIGV
mgnify:CR=1 FL=1